MSINQKQFEQLSEMGIGLWQRRSLDLESTSTDNSSESIRFDRLEPSSLTTNKLFQDILRAIGSSIGEITFKDNHLDLGLFNWYFTDNDEHQNQLSWSAQKLISPSIERIATSPELKKQLWNILSKET